MGYWAEIRNNYFESGSDVDRNLEGDVLATISIDAWKTMDDNEEGRVIARVLLSNHGDILVDYHDNVARVDTAAQEAIAEAKKELETYYRESVIGRAEKEPAPVRSVQAEEPTIALWARLGVSLNVTPRELAALKHPYDQNAKNLLVDLVRSNRCSMDGETYFPAGPNEEHLGDMEEELEFDLAGALHKDALVSLNKLSEEKAVAAKKCLVDNGVEPDEAETVLQALGYILMDKELFPEAEKLPPTLDETIALARAEASAGKENSVAAPSRDRI